MVKIPGTKISHPMIMNWKFQIINCSSRSGNNNSVLAYSMYCYCLLIIVFLFRVSFIRLILSIIIAKV